MTWTTPTLVEICIDSRSTAICRLSFDPKYFG